MRRSLTYLAGWLAAVVVATAVGFAAVSLVGDDVGVSKAALRLTEQPEPSASPSATRTDRSRATARPDGDEAPEAGTRVRGATRTEVTEGGTVTGRCWSTGPTLVRWSAREGWLVGPVRRASDRRVLTFTGAERSVVVTLRCDGLAPDFTVRTRALEPTPAPTTSSPSASPTTSVVDEP